MKKRIYMTGIAILLILGLLTSGMIPVIAQSHANITIDKALSPSDREDVYSIPVGSTIYHLDGGVTEVYGPDKARILSTKDSEAKMLPTPSGPRRATYVHSVPRGSYIENAGNTTKVYKDEVCILTVVNQKTRGDNPPIPDIHPWIEQARDLDVDGLDNFRAKWDCPSDPPDPGNDVTDFIFNGIQEVSGAPDYIVLLQPVIEWNYDGSGCWEGRVWVVWTDDHYKDETPIDVSEGDEMWGQMFVYSSNSWYVYLTNYTDLDVSYLWTNRIDGPEDNLQIFCVLEGFNYDDDDDMPGDTEFYDMIFKDDLDDDIDITWDGYVTPGTGLSGLSVTIYSDSNVKLNTAN